MKNLTYFAVYDIFDMGSEGRRVYGTSSPAIETCQRSPEYGTASLNAYGKFVPIEEFFSCPYQDNDIYGQT